MIIEEKRKVSVFFLVFEELKDVKKLSSLSSGFSSLLEMEMEVFKLFMKLLFFFV